MNLTFRNMNIKKFLVIATLCLLISACNIGKTDIAAEKPADTTKPAESTTTTNLDDAVQGYLGDDKSKKQNKKPTPTPTPERRVICDYQRGCARGVTTIGKGVKVLETN